MKTLLINPTYFDPIRYPPANLAYLASGLRAAGEEVAIIDVNIGPRCVDAIRAFSPDVVGFPMMSFSEPTVAKFVKKVKKVAGAKVVVGGPHVSIMQEDVLASHPEIDFAVIGEGEKALPELCAALRGKRALGSVRGLAYREGGSVLKTALREYNIRLDELPFPAWDLLDVRRYDFLPVVDSRGCPYRCNYCCVKDAQGRAWRPRSAENIVDEIQWDIRQFGVRRFYIDGDNLLVDAGRILKICDGIRRRDLRIRWVATQGVRADLATGEVLSAMRGAGCEAVGFGIESGDEEVLQGIHKGETLAEISSAVKMARDRGFYVTGCFMVGNVGETMSSVKKSIAFMKTLRLDAIYVNSVVPYPKTDLWEWAKSHAIGFREDRAFFPATLQAGDVEPAFETREFPRDERIRAYRLFLREAFWTQVRHHFPRRALFGILLKGLKERLAKLAYRVSGKDPRERVLKRCDLWRENP